jgi:hypothetical protein
MDTGVGKRRHYFILPRRPFGGKYFEKLIVLVVVNQMNPLLYRQVVAVLVYFVYLQRSRWAQIETTGKQKFVMCLLLLFCKM